MNIALLVAIEGYTDGSFAPLPHAHQDALDFAKALIPVGFGEIDQVVLLGSQATRTLVESKIRRTLRSLGKEDQLFLLFIGHYGEYRGQLALACYDTLATDFEETSYPLASLLSAIRESESSRIIVFWDGRAHDLGQPQGENLAANLLDQEFADYFPAVRRSVCLAACEPTQKNWPLDGAGHSAWMTGMLQAFQGKSQATGRSKKQLTPAGLHQHLQESLPRLLRTAYVEEKMQSPVLYASATHAKWVIADLTELLESQKSVADKVTQASGRLLLVREQKESVRTLPSFNKKTHQVPADTSHHSQRFVASLASSLIDQEVDQFFKGLRSEFKFKRADLSVAKPGDGTATIITPFFSYSITVSQDPADPSEILWQRQISEIKDVSKVLSREFATVFEKVFDRVDYFPAQPIVLSDLIDRVEAAEDGRILLDYDSAITWLHLRMSGIAGHIEVTPQKISIIRDRSQSPRELLEAFFAMQSTLQETCDLQVLDLPQKSPHEE